MLTPPFSLEIAFRFSQSKKKGRLISLISIIAILGNMLGVSVLIISLSVINGFEHELKNRVLSVLSHGKIISIAQPYFNWIADLRKIQKTPGVLGVSPYINFTGLLEKRTNLKVIQVIGVDLFSENTVSSLPRFILNDAWKKLKPGKNEIILGQGIASILKVFPGENITIVIPKNDDALCIRDLNRITARVVGVFKINGVLDQQLGIVPLQDAQKYLNYGDGITGFKIRVNDVFSANKVVYNAAINTGNNVLTRSWITDFGYMYNDIQMVRSIMHLCMALVVAVSCFNIASTLLMEVKNKRSDIGILKTLGAKDNFVRVIFLWYGLIIGTIGCFLGILLGVFISLNLRIIIERIENIIGHPILSSGIYFIDFLPSKIHIEDIFYIILITLILSLFFSWYPAQRANKIEPARILSDQ